MKKILRFSFLISLAEKRALERLAEVNEESQASFLRRLIRQAFEPRSRANSAHYTLEPTSAEGVTDSEIISGEEVI